MQIPKNSALLIIDMINNFDFEHGKILANKTLHILNPLIKIKQYFKHHSLPIIYINDHYNLWQANVNKIIDTCKNPISELIIKTITPDDNDFFLIKPKHSAFYGTALNTLLHQLEIENLVLTGIAGNICVLFTANDAYMREFQLYIPKDCIASVSDEDQTYALLMMKNVLKAEIFYSQDLIYPSI